MSSAGSRTSSRRSEHNQSTAAPNGMLTAQSCREQSESTERTAADPSGYSYESLDPARADVARRAAASIRERSRRETEAKSAWLLHGLDLLKARRVIPHGAWEAWIKAEARMSVRTAENMRAAAEMIVAEWKSENFADLPRLSRSIIYRLAAPSIPARVRTLFLPRLLGGKTVTLRELDRALHPTPKVAPDIVHDPADAADRRIREPTATASALVESMDRDQARGLLIELQQGRIEDLIIALEWKLAAPGTTVRNGSAEVGRGSNLSSGRHVYTEEKVASPSDYGTRNARQPLPFTIVANVDPIFSARSDLTPRSHSNRAKAATRVRALRNKTIANGCTEKEARAAAEKANDLIDQYALDLTDQAAVNT